MAKPALLILKNPHLGWFAQVANDNPKNAYVFKGENLDEQYKNVRSFAQLMENNDRNLLIAKIPDLFEPGEGAADNVLDGVKVSNRLLGLTSSISLEGRAIFAAAAEEDSLLLVLEEAGEALLEAL